MVGSPDRAASRPKRAPRGERLGANGVDLPEGGDAGDAISSSEHNHIMAELQRELQQEIDAAVLKATADTHAIYVEHSFDDQQGATSKLEDILIDDLSLQNLLSEHTSCLDELLNITTEGYIEPKSKPSHHMFDRSKPANKRLDGDMLDRFKTELKQAEQAQEARYGPKIADRDAHITRLLSATAEDQAAYAKKMSTNAEDNFNVAVNATSETSHATPSFAMLELEFNKEIEFLLIAAAEDEAAAAQEASEQSNTATELDQSIHNCEASMDEMRIEQKEEGVEMKIMEAAQADMFFAELAARDALMVDELAEADNNKDEALKGLEADHLDMIEIIKEENAEETQYQLELAEDAAERHLQEEEDMIRSEFEAEQDVAGDEYDELLAELRQASAEISHANRERDNVKTALEELQELRKVEDENLAKEALANLRAGPDAAAGHGGSHGDAARPVDASRREDSRTRKPTHGHAKKNTGTLWKC